MPIALDPKEPFDYVLESERELPPEEQTTFELRGLTIAEETSLSDNVLSSSSKGADEEQVLSWKTGSYSLKALRLGLLGWRNFPDKEGNSVVFAADKNGRAGRSAEIMASMGSLDRIGSPDRTELTNAITSRGKVTTVEGN